MEPLLFELLNAFGGVRPAARALGVPVTTVSGWKTKGKLPHWRKPSVDAALAAMADLEDLTPPYPKAV